jgi:hypothetical protein
MINPWASFKFLPNKLAVLFLTAAVAVAVGGCGVNPTALPTAQIGGTPTAMVTPASTPESFAKSTVAPVAAPTTAIPASTLVPLTLDILSPVDGVELEVGTLRLIARTRPDAVVVVNGVPLDVDLDGQFHQDMLLEEGTNLIEVVSSDISGQMVSKTVAAFYLPPSQGIPLTVFYPTDGLEVTNGAVEISGASTPDAMIVVNGTPVDVNATGLFSSRVALEQGANVIEVMATNLQGDQREQTLAVFYTP